MERAFKGVWISAEIWLNKNLTIMEKLFLVEIDSLDNEHGCFASNAHFSDFFDLSKSRCTEIIKSLEAKKMITIEYVFDDGKSIKKRVLRVVSGVFGKPNLGVRKTELGYSENRTGVFGKPNYNNTSINNTNRERNALNFLEDFHASEFESLMMKYRSKITDFEKAKADFNLTFDKENLDYSSKIINARAQLFFNRWIENQDKYSAKQFSSDVQIQNNNPSRKRFEI